MLDQLRALGTNILAKILLAVLVLAFGIWGVGDMLRHPGHGAAVATVGSASISGDEFARALRRETEDMRRMMGDNVSPEMLKSLNLPQLVLHHLINHKLIQLDAEALGLVPSDADVVRHIRSNPAFQDSHGNFDKSLFEAHLRGTNQSEQTYVEQLRLDMASGILTDTLTANAPALDAAAATLYNAHEEERLITVYVLSPALVENVPQPSEEQIASYYKDHAREFTAPEYRTVSYVTLSDADVRAAPVSDEALRAAYKDRLDEFKRPEQRTVEQLLYSSEDKAKAAAAMLKSGKSPEAVAKETNPLNKNAVSLGKVDKSGIIDAAADTVFALKAGESTAPIKSPFGWHVFHVSAVYPPSTAPFEEVKATLEKDLKQQNAEEGLSRMANQLQDALAGGASMQQAAGDVGLKSHALGPIDRDGRAPDGSKQSLPDLDKFLDTVFRTDDKSESPLITAKNGTYYLVRVDNVTPERQKPLEEVKPYVSAAWQKEERAKRLGMLAGDIAAKFSGKGRDAIITQYHLQPAASAAVKRASHLAGDLPLPPEMVADAFRHKPGETTKAYPLRNGDYGIAVMGSVIAAPAPDADAKSKEAMAEIRKNLRANAQNEVLEQYLRYLTNKYPILVNQSALQAVAQ